MPSLTSQIVASHKMNVPRLSSNLVYRTGQQPPPRPQYSRHQTPQRPSYPIYDDYEYRYDSARPTPRSRRSMDVPRSDPRYGPAALIDEMYMGRRSSHRSPPMHSQTNSTLPHQTYQGASGPHRLAFDHAASRLYNALTTSRCFFGELLDIFDREISGIKTYADAKIIESLWRKKIEKMDEEGAKQSERPQHENQVPRNPNLPSPPPPPSGHPIETFWTTSSRLIDALKTAAQSVPYRTQVVPPPPPPPMGFNTAPTPPTPPPPPPKSELEILEETDSMKRLIKKLQSQYKDLHELIEGSKKNARKCGELVKDLGILLDVLNNSGNLWRQGNINEG
jgi:hypothetical protein